MTIHDNNYTADVSRTQSYDLLEGVSNTRLLAGGVVLAAITGMIHLWLAFEEWGDAEEALPFLLAGIGFFVGIGFVLFADRRKRLLYLLGAGFTAIEIPLWILEGMNEFALGVFDKLVQVLLIAVLLYLWYRSRPATAMGRHT